MPTFDPELYLRMLGERWLLASERNQGFRSGPVEAAGAALADAGVITLDQAEVIVEDYLDASEIRSAQDVGRHRLHRHGGGSPTSTALASRRVARVDAAISKGDWELRLNWVSATDTTTRLSGSAERPRLRNGAIPHPPTLDVRLPDGRSRQVGYSGGWGSSGLHGSYELEETGDWIEVEGHRVDLQSATLPPAVLIVPLAEMAPAVRHLWQLLDGFSDRHGPPGLEPAASALIAAGELEADDPQLAAVEWVSEQRGNGPWSLRHGRGASPISGGPPGVPDHWRSVLSHSQFTGPTGTLPVGAATPLFDGMSFAVNALHSHPDGFTLNAEWVGVADMGPFGSTLHRTAIAWWAFDDRDNHYLGSAGAWSGGGPGGSGAGQIEFTPLDPKATRLTLAPTGATSRALIPIDLDWPA